MIIVFFNFEFCSHFDRSTAINYGGSPSNNSTATDNNGNVTKKLSFTRSQSYNAPVKKSLQVQTSGGFGQFLELPNIGQVKTTSIPAISLDDETPNDSTKLIVQLSDADETTLV